MKLIFEHCNHRKVMKSPLLSQEPSKGEKPAMLLSHNLAHVHQNNKASPKVITLFDLSGWSLYWGCGHTSWSDCSRAKWRHCQPWLVPSCSILNLHYLLGLLPCGPAGVTIQLSTLCFNKSKSDELICHKYKVLSRLSCCNSLGPEVIDHLSSHTRTARDLEL